ncbi:MULTISPECIES: HipA domain-containing protein [unclassified Shewanella]|uniref:HipA domain-containing protein n=1 Tax=Shewanella TaxID=22 RepID=UPI0021D83E29|nr:MULTISPECIES: HipA domain-containing protein [unclassified Shewanella]MCU8004852.1 HipA domain-containing protein [Shewanella sp. SM96]MCU8021757.1 HipA domain-containing protein [Shewanella sp. SM78]MCU8043526.1 HipA domain-containing protein [Shewanella sp. SM68]MCU8048788.1 HipA domain-containing protein [Shewanella sp. SM65]MCU8063189.1 HipA domain-containing protein [Shewanella sp. SM55]
MSTSKKLTLEMHLGDLIIGELSFDATTDTFAVYYTKDWQQSGFPLSPTIPLDGTGSSSQISMFLVNLLPENKGLDYLIESLGVSKGNTFALIRAIGLDTAGAVAFVPKGTLLPETQLRPIKAEEVIQRIEDPTMWPMEIWDGKPRLSVAGVQPKLNLFYNGEKFAFAEGALSSTHIVKFEKYRHLVLNEFMTMRLAKAIGMNVANVDIVHFGDYKVLCVERFDRRYIPNAQRVLRRHIVDSCQALGFSVSKKYERNFGSGRDVKDIREGVSFNRLFSLAAKCCNPVAAKQDMLQWALFNLLTGNADAHGKNYSFFMTPSGMEPTPWYDLVSVAMYEDFEQQLAMAIDDEFDPNSIYAYQLAAFIDGLGLPRNLLISNLTTIARRIPQAIAEVVSMLPALDESETSFVALYKAQLLARCDRYLSFAAEVRDVKV